MMGLWRSLASALLVSLAASQEPQANLDATVLAADDVCAVGGAGCALSVLQHLRSSHKQLPDFKKLANQVVEGAQGVAQQAIDTANNATAGLSDLAAGAQGAAQQAVDAASSATAEVADELKAGTQVVRQQVLGAVGNATAAVDAATQQAIGAVSGASASVDAATKQATEAANAAQATAHAVAQQAIDAVNNATSNATATVDTAKGVIEKALKTVPEDTRAAVEDAVKQAQGAISDASKTAQGAVASVVGQVNALGKELNITLPDLSKISGSVEQLEKQLQDEVLHVQEVAKAQAAASSAEVQAQLDKATAELTKTAAAAEEKVEAAKEQAAEVVAERLGSTLTAMPEEAQKTLEEVVAKVAAVGSDKAAAHRGSVSVATALLVTLLAGAVV